MKKLLASQSTRRASLFIRVGLAFAFLYAAIASFQHPDTWLGYIPNWLPNLLHIPSKFLLDSISVFQILLAGLLLGGKYVKYVGVISAGLLLSIVLVNPSSLVITFRDIPMITASLALWFLDE